MQHSPTQRWCRYGSDHIPAQRCDLDPLSCEPGRSLGGWTRHRAGIRSDRTPILRHSVVPLDDEDWIVDEVRHTTKQRSVESLDVLHLQRLQLGMSYPAQVAMVREILARPPLRGIAQLVLDFTGCGRPVADLFCEAGLTPVQVCITGGFEAEFKGANTWSVPKHLLISSLQATLHTGVLRFAPSLREASAMAEELKDFSRHTSAAGRNIYEARGSAHDDLVLSVALAVWFVNKPSRGEYSIGTVKGLF